MIALIILYIIFSVGGLILFKLGSNGLSFSIKLPDILFHVNIVAVVGIVFYLLSFILWMIIVKNSKITYVTPIIMGIVAIVTLICGKYILGEQMGTPHVIGSILIIAGVMIIRFFE